MTVTETAQDIATASQKWKQQEKEIARLHKIIELMYAAGNKSDLHYSINRIYDMFTQGVDENGMGCDCCECAPCICEGRSDEQNER